MMLKRRVSVILGLILIISGAVMVWKRRQVPRMNIYAQVSDMLILDSNHHETTKPRTTTPTKTKPTDPKTTRPTTKPLTTSTEPKTTKPTTEPLTTSTEPKTTKPTTKPVTTSTEPTTTKPTTEPITTNPKTTKPTTEPITTNPKTTMPTTTLATKPTDPAVITAEVTGRLEIRASAKDRDYGDNTCGPHKELKEYREVLQYWVDLADKYNLTYVLSCGSLFGAWRDEQIIPWDTDVDVLLYGNDNIKLDRIRDKRPFENDGKFRIILQEDWRLPYEKRRRLRCDNKEVQDYSGLCAFQDPLGRIIKSHWYMDIYDFTVTEDYITDLAVSSKLKLYKIEDIFPRKKCKLMGIETMCPNNPPGMLNAIYGDKLAPKYKCKNRKWVTAK